MRQLSGAEQEELRKAILHAYQGIVGINALVQALAAAELNWFDYAGPFDIPETILFTLIQQENTKYRIPDVIGAVRRARPQDPLLAELEAKWLATAAAEETQRLEGMVVERLDYQPAETWSAALQGAFRWVCRIEDKKEGRNLGTGFLVANDIVLTNYHVMFGVRPPGTPDPRQVQLRFDTIGAGAGRLAEPLATNGVIAKSPPGGSEWGGVGDPGPHQLDFVLVRLTDKIASDPVEQTVRGYAKIDDDTSTSGARHPMLVLQHPRGASLQVCAGVFEGTNNAGTRLRHSATTQSGSSGSPCLSMELKVVGLHNSGVGTAYNTAVPLRLITTFLKKSGITIG